MALPYTYYANIWDAQAATATVTLPNELRHCPVKVFEIITTGFSGTLDIKGRIRPSETGDNATYYTMGQALATAASNAQLSWTTSTARVRYLVSEPYMDMSLVMTRSAGSITINVGGWGVALYGAGTVGLAAGTNAIGKLAANSGVDIGDVDVLSVVPGTGATNLGKAEDAAHTSGDVGVQILAVRQDTAAALAGTDADYIPLIVDASGRLHVAQSGLELADDAAFTVATSKVIPIGAMADETSPDSVDEGDVGIPRMTLSRILWAALRGKNTASADTEIKSSPAGGLWASIATSTAITDGAAAAGARGQGDTNVAMATALMGRNTDGAWDRVNLIGLAAGSGGGVLRVGTMGELITLAASAARTASANGTAVTGLGWRNRYVILFDLTVADTDAGDTLDVYVDVSLDGTTWLNAVHFTQIVGTDSASKRFAILDPSNPGTAEIVVTSDAAAGVVRPALFGPQMRARWAITDAGTDDASFTFSVVAYAL